MSIKTASEMKEILHQDTKAFEDLSKKLSQIKQTDN
jgi:hypothetical protein